MVNAFYQNFEEIMEYYKGKRKQKADLIDSLIRDKDPLRPMAINTENFFFSSF